MASCAARAGSSAKTQHASAPSARSPGLRSAIWTHREAEASLGRQQSAAARLQSGSTEIKVQLDRVTAALRQVAANARQPERALEIAVRQTSRAAIQTAVLILPSPSSYRCASPCGPSGRPLESAQSSAAKDIFEAGLPPACRYLR